MNDSSLWSSADCCYWTMKQCFMRTGDLQQSTSAKMNIVSNQRTIKSGLEYACCCSVNKRYSHHSCLCTSNVIITIIELCPIQSITDWLTAYVHTYSRLLAYVLRETERFERSASQPVGVLTSAILRDRGQSAATLGITTWRRMDKMAIYIVLKL